MEIWNDKKIFSNSQSINLLQAEINGTYWKKKSNKKGKENRIQKLLWNDKIYTYQ